MRTFQKFIIASYERDPKSLEARFYYSFDNEVPFCETINFFPLFDQEQFPIARNEAQEIQQILIHMHIALGVSYYKLFPTKTIEVQTLALNTEQKHFRNEFYLKGLGEFFYKNQLDPRGLANFISSQDENTTTPLIKFPSKKWLVLFGGGKDSLVTVEKMKQEGTEFDLFSFGQNYPLHQIAQQETGEKRLSIQRTLDLPQIKAMLAQGYYNGHLPITGIISFVSLLVSYLYGYRGVVTSLEKSADDENTIYCDMKINHQRSKSSEFEQAFQKYVKSFLSLDFSIFSLLRTWYEIRIVQEFCKYPQYFYSFSSCNRNFHQEGPHFKAQELRCGACPKCAFVYVCMRAFLPKATVDQVFGKALFEDQGLLSLFRELVGLEGIKPFECVGTQQEAQLAFWLIQQKGEGAGEGIFIQIIQELQNRYDDEHFHVLYDNFLCE